MAKDIIITPADGDIVFDNSSGTECGAITQDGNNLVISNAVGDVLIGDGASDVYIGDGTNNVDILFEQSAAIKAEDGSSGVTLTLGSSDTTLALGSPISSDLTVGVNDTGHDVKFFGATAGSYMLWDQSADTLVVDGTLDINGDASILSGAGTGTLTVGRNGNENMVFYVDDSNTTITGVQDSDTNGAHSFILNRTFLGSGANNFIIQKGGTAQLTLDTSDAATFAGTIDSGAITSTGNIRLPNSGKLYTWTGHDLNFLKYDTWEASATAGMTINNVAPTGEIYLKSGNALALTLDENQAATFAGNVHVNSTTDNGAGISLIQSATYPEVRIQAGENGTTAFSIYNTATNPDAEQFYINNNLASSHLGNARGALKLEDSTGLNLTLSSGNATFAGTIGSGAITSTGKIQGTELEGTSLDINGAADISGITTLGDQIHFTAGGSLIKKSNTGWTSATTHDVMYQGWLSGVGDYVYLKAPGNSTTDHGVVLVGDDVIALGRSDVEEGHVDNDSATAPLSENWLVLNGSSATFAGEIEGGSLDINGDADISGNLTVTGTNYGAYHSVVEDQYYFDDYNGSRNLSMFYKNSRSDLIRYQAVGNFEYWNGSAWVADANQESNVEKLLDGRQDTSWAVPSTYYKFRFTTKQTSSWPTMAMVWMQTSWAGSTYPGATMLVEEYDGSSWATKVTAEFTSTNGNTNWGLHSRADTALHTGNGSSADTTRITIDFYGWSPSNGSYTTIPLQNLMITSNYAGTENTDYTNLFNHARNLTIPAGITLDGNTISGIDDSSEFTDDDAHIMTSAAINDRIQASIIANTDTQDLSIAGQTLSLTNSPDVTLPTQTTVSGNAGTVTNGVYTTGNQTISGAKTFNSTILGSISGNAATATQATNLNATDDRDMAPEDYSYSDDFRVFFTSKEGLEDGTSTSGNWMDAIYLNSYGDSSGHDANVLAFDKSEKAIYHYQADQAATNWGTAKQLAYTDYVDTAETDAVATAATAAESYADGLASNYATAAQGTTADSAQQPPSEGAFANGDKTKLDAIEASATADQTQADINGLAITTVGALGSGTIASGFGNIDNGTSTLDTGVATVASLVCTADATFGGGYGSTGATISTIGTINTDSGIECTGTVMINGDGATTAGRILIREGTDNGTHYIGISAPASLTANTSFTLPDGDGSANQVLKTDGSGTLAWTDMSGGTVGWHGSGTRIKILHSDFIAADGGRPIMIDDTGVASEELFLESFSSNPLYATVAIPTGYTATHVMIYGSATDAVEVWEHQINSKTGVSKGTGNVDTEIDITNVASSTTNYLFIQVANASGNEIHGGYVTIAES